MMATMPAPPASTSTSLGQRLAARARDRWPALTQVSVRIRGQIAYITGHLPGGETLPLCRLRYGGSASSWGRYVPGHSGVTAYVNGAAFTPRT
jgi:hypothetical protein